MNTTFNLSQKLDAVQGQSRRSDPRPALARREEVHMGGLERDAHSVGFAHMRCVVGVHAREQSAPRGVERDVESLQVRPGRKIKKFNLTRRCKHVPCHCAEARNCLCAAL